MTGLRRGLLLALAGALGVIGCGSNGPTPGPEPSPSISVTTTAGQTPRASVPSMTSTPVPTRPRPTATRPTPTPSPSPSSSSALPASLAGNVITAVPAAGRRVILTFDGGSGAQGAPSVVATLTQTRTPASFFLTGNFTQNNPELVRRLHENGWLIGNHTMSHPHPNQLAFDQLRQEVTDAERVIERETTVDPRPWFRFPYGEHNARTLDLVNGMGYAAIGWTVDTLGWEGSANGQSASSVVSRVLTHLQPGQIVLMHLGAAPDGTTLDADALPELIRRIHAAGYGFTTLVALLRR